MKKYAPWLTLALFLVCVLTAFFFRTWHYNHAVYDLGKAIKDVPASQLSEPGWMPAYHPNFSPFTIESGMMFAYAQDVATGKGVPARDSRLNGLEDLPPYAQMNMALEWFLGWGWRIKNAVSPDPAPTKAELRFQDHPRMAQWMSGQIRLWASLSSGLIFLWLLQLGCPKWLSLIAGLLHAVSPAAIARSTGQDLVRGEFCIPLILCAFLLAESIYRHPKQWKYTALFCVTALAFAAWDLCQMLFGAWAMYEVLRFVLGFRMTRPRFYAWCAIAAAILFNVAFVPFHQAYSLWRAQTVWVALPTLFAAFALFRQIRIRKVWYWRLLCAAGTFGVLFLFWKLVLNTPEYASNYSHFSEAMRAKLQFWNEKPLDPSRLSYDARMLWTPSMTSATWQTAGTFFPGLMIRSIAFRPLHFLLCDLPLGPALFILLLSGTFLFTPIRNEAKRRSGLLLMPVLFCIGFLIGFIYIIRYHEFVIIFLTMSLALLCQVYCNAFHLRSVPPDAPPWMSVYRHPKCAALLRWLPALLFGALLCYEASVSVRSQRRYTGDVAMQETAGLIEWFRREPARFEGKGVAANFTICPMLRAYAGTGVVMNPQFGLKCIRDATEEYLNILFHGTEAELADYCRRRNARFVVFRRTDPDEVPPILDQMRLLRSAKDKEHLTTLKRVYTAAWIYSNRYIANALEIPEDAVCRKLYRASDPAHPEPSLLKSFRFLPPPDDLATLLSRGYAVFEYVPEGNTAP